MLRTNNWSDFKEWRDYGMYEAYNERNPSSLKKK